MTESVLKRIYIICGRYNNGNDIRKGTCPRQRK